MLFKGCTSFPESCSIIQTMVQFYDIIRKQGHQVKLYDR